MGGNAFFAAGRLIYMSDKKIVIMFNCVYAPVRRVVGRNDQKVGIKRQKEGP